LPTSFAGRLNVTVPAPETNRNPAPPFSQKALLEEPLS